MKTKLLFLNLCLVLSISMLAQDSTKVNPILTDRFVIGAGVFFPDTEFIITLDGNNENLPVDMNKVFDRTEDAVTGMFMAQWRFSKKRKWIMQVEYFNLKNENRGELEEDLAWRDKIFKEGTYAEAGVDLQMYRIFLGRQIIGGPKYEIGGGLGLHSLNVESYIEGEIIMDEDTEFGKETANFTAPLPDIGFWATYAPHPKWSFDARLDWFYVALDEFEGGLWDIAPSVTYQITKHVGTSLSYHYFNVDLTVKKEKVNGIFDLTFNGPSLSVFGNF